MNNEPPTPPAAPCTGADDEASKHDLFVESVDNAELLLGYVNRNGIDVDSKVVVAVTAARDLVREAKHDPAQEQALYEAYRTLAKLVAPVSVASLRDSLDVFGLLRKRWGFFGERVRCSLATIACRRQKAWAFVALILLVLVQSYWVVGNNLVESIPNLRRNVPKQAAESGNTAGTDKGTASTTKAVTVAPAATPAPATPAPTQPTAAASATSPQSGDSGNGPLVMVSPENTQTLIDPLTGFPVFSFWNPAAAGGSKSGEDGNQITDRVKELSRGLLLIRWGKPWKRLITSAETQKLIDQEGLKENALIAVASGHVLDILQYYILPLLYGWLGAMAFVVRALAREARDRTYRAENDLAYRMRIYLGVLSGLAIGWFFTPDNTARGAQISSLPPFALAFVAGYSVDLLFTVMDKLLTAFSSQPNPSTQKQPNP